MTATVYSKEFCSQGGMKNQVQKQPFDLFVDWMSALTIRGNQLKLGRSNFTCVFGNIQRNFSLTKPTRKCTLPHAPTPTVQIQ